MRSEKYNLSVYQPLVRTVPEGAVVLKDDLVTGIHIIIDVSDVVGAAAITVSVDGFDPLSRNFYTLLTGLPITTVSTNVLRIHPSLPSSPNLIAQDFLPERYRISVSHGNGDAITYSVGVNAVSH